MLSSVSSEDAQDRSDRVLLTPWVKFLWEAYRNVLELLRNNNRVERLYHETAQSGKHQFGPKRPFNNFNPKIIVLL